MPTKKQLYEIVAMELSGGVPQRASKYSDPRPIYAIMDTVRDDLVRKDIYTLIFEQKFINSNYVFPYESVPVLLNSARNMRYSDLPVKILTFPDNKGVQQIAPMQSLEDQFVYTTRDTQWLFKDNEASGLQNNKAYFVENGKVYYPNINPLMTSVLMMLITAGADIADGEFYIVDDLQQQLIAATLAIMQPMQKPQDLSNNNA